MNVGILIYYILLLILNYHFSIVTILSQLLQIVYISRIKLIHKLQTLKQIKLYYIVNELHLIFIFTYFQENNLIQTIKIMNICGIE